MKKLVCNLLLVFAVLYPSSALASSTAGKAIYCERDKGAIKIEGRTFGSAVGVHFYSASTLRVSDNTDRNKLYNAEYEPLNNKITWRGTVGSWTLNRQSLYLNIYEWASPLPFDEYYSCKVVSPKVMRAKLEESRERETAGNKL